MRTTARPQIRSATSGSDVVLEDPGVPQQIGQGELARLLAWQIRLPGAPWGQYRVRAAPDQHDQDLRYDRAADRSEVLAITEGRRFGQDVVPQRRALQEPGVLEHLDLFLARRTVPDLLGGEHGSVAHALELRLKRAGDGLARGHAQ